MTTLRPHLLILLACLAALPAALAPSAVARADATPAIVATHAQAPLVVLRSFGPVAAKPSWTFILAHGRGGTQPGDRFHQLARAIKERDSSANVLLIDWTPSATLTNGFGLPQVWRTAGRIDAVASEAAALLKELGIDARQTTLIGESFGAYLAGKLAEQLGGVEHLLAFNPASELGGYSPLDLRRAAHVAWSFHTYSVFDTTREIAHADFFLETPAGADATAQHTHGIAWLARRIEAGDLSWLQMEKSVPTAKPAAFRAAARLDGRLEDAVISRERPQPEAAAA